MYSINEYDAQWSKRRKDHMLHFTTTEIRRLMAVFMIKGFAYRISYCETFGIPLVAIIRRSLNSIKYFGKFYLKASTRAYMHIKIILLLSCIVRQ